MVKVARAIAQAILQATLQATLQAIPTVPTFFSDDPSHANNFSVHNLDRLYALKIPAYTTILLLHSEHSTTAVVEDRSHPKAAVAVT